MRYINLKSRRGLVNLFAEHILSSINTKYNSIIQVVDFKNFFVICGQTGSPEVLDIEKLKKSFSEKYNNILEFLEIKNINTIDLIEYKEPKVINNYHFKFYNSDRPIYHQSIIDLEKDDTIISANYTDCLEVELTKDIPTELFSFNELNSVSSEFPYGYSKNMGRIQFYYSEYICSQLIKSLNSQIILFRYSDEKEPSGDFNINVIGKTIYSCEDVKSLILDVFDFNLDRFNSLILGDYDFINDLVNPFIEKPWLIKDKVKDLIIV